MQVKPFIKNTVEDSEYIFRILHNACKIENGEVLPIGILITDILSPNNNRNFNPSFEAVKEVEIKRLIDREKRNIALKRNIPNDVNILSSRLF